jgi:hypothetical protein
MENLTLPATSGGFALGMADEKPEMLKNLKH